MLIGTKYDLLEENPKNREVSEEDIKTLCNSHSLDYFDTSSKTNHNIAKSFESLVENIYAMGDKNPANSADFQKGVSISTHLK